MHLSVNHLHHIFKARAFTHGQLLLPKPVKGNPATSYFVPQGLPETSYGARMAIKSGAPMSVFVAPLSTSSEFELRFFTPQGSIFPLCGHASMVAALQLQQLYGLEQIRFRLNDMGSRPVWLNARVKAGFVQVQMPAYPPVASDLPEMMPVMKALGLHSHEVYSIHQCEKLNDIILQLKDPEVLRNVVPDIPAMKDLLAAQDVRGLFITSASAESELDYEVRIFAPHLGIEEDVSCGSANCSILPLWSQLLNRKDEEIFKVLCPYSRSTPYYGGVEYVRYIEQKTVIEVGGYVTAMINE